MSDNFTQSREALAYSQEALRNGAMEEAREWAERAAQLMPQSEEPWLMLARVSRPGESVEYVRRALDLNPNSARAKKGMEWAMRRQNEMPEARAGAGNLMKQLQSPAQSDSSSRTRNPRRRNAFLPAVLVVMGCAVFLFAAWSAARSPVLASIMGSSNPPVAQQPRVSYARVEIAKPAGQAQPVAVNIPDIAAVPTLTNTPVVEPTAELGVADVVVADAPTTIVQPVNTAIVPTVDSSVQGVEPTGVALAEIVQDTPTSEYVAPTAAPNIPPVVAGSGDGVHWIDVDLSQQRLYAYAGDTLVNSFLASTGTWQTPTVTGSYKVWVKLRSSDMTGPGYYLPDVPWVMYFYKDYGIHGTYWHNNFGTPMSHGCVNLSIPDAEWVYNFSSVGTVVNVHY
jgi:lipoprotein-anchoring transpeptidase ErfK/SrfK